MSILFNRVVITCLFYCLLQSFAFFSIISEGIGIHGGLFHITTITQIFHIFLYFITILILQLTGFFPRIFRDDSLVDLFSDDTSINETGEHLKTI
jgi:NADH-ubiquinone oxidoreductase chain 2